MNVYENPLVTGVVLGLIATIPSYLVYKHSKRADELADETQESSANERVSAMVVQALNSIMDRTEKDNTEMRASLKELAGQMSQKDEHLSKALADFADCVATTRDLRAQLVAMETKYSPK